MPDTFPSGNLAKTRLGVAYLIGLLKETQTESLMNFLCWQHFTGTVATLAARGSKHVLKGLQQQKTLNPALAFLGISSNAASSFADFALYSFAV